MSKSVDLTIRREVIDDDVYLTLQEEMDSSGHAETRGGDLLRTEDKTFVPAFGKRVRDLARKHPEAILTFKVI